MPSSDTDLASELTVMPFAIALLLLLSPAVTVQTPGSASSASSVVRVFVATGEGIGSEFTELLASVKDLSAALAAKKKTIVLVENSDAADVVIAAIDRAIEVPKVAFGVDVRPGRSTGVSPQIRRAILKVRLSFSDVNLALKNKNIANDNPKGWKSAADDVADQIEKWIKNNHKAIISKRLTM